MKTFLYTTLLSIVLLGGFSCSEQLIPTYNGDRYLFFTSQDPKKWVDSTIVSFKNNPGKTSLKIGFEVNLIGNIPLSDVAFNIEVIDSLTTADKSLYDLQTQQIFHAGQMKDSMFVTIYQTELLTTNVHIAFLIQPSEHFAGGKPGERIYRLFFNNVMTQPDWWTKSFANAYLGPYSDEKYTQFIVCTGISDLSKCSADEKRLYALKFKQYVIDNNLNMTVPII